MRSLQLSQGKRFYFLSCIGALLTCLLLCHNAQAGTPQSAKGSIHGKVTIPGPQAEPGPLEGVRVELDSPTPNSKPLETATDADGKFAFENLPAGSYSVRIAQPGFKPFTRIVSLSADQSLVVDATLTLETVTEKVEVQEQTEKISTENSSPAATVNNEAIESLPNAEQRFRDLLPIVPGVVRTLDGKLSVRGTSETQGMLQVDSAKTVDPVTGAFSIPVPIDAIQKVSVDKTPFSAENGGFSGGLTSVETTPPPSSWFYTIKDFNVSIRGKNDSIVGIARATPRVAFGGPLDDGKITFSEVFEYDVTRDPVRGLAWPRNEIKRQGFNSFTRLQAILSTHDVLSADVNVFPMRTQFANITALIPQTASSDYDQKGVSAGIAEVHSFGSGALLRLPFRYTRFDSNGHGQGTEDLLLTPENWGGNFFNSWTRTSNQFEFNPTYQSATKKWLGRHVFKIGADLLHRSYTGTSLSQPVQLLREDGTLAEQIGFTSNGPLGASATDIEEFVGDHWTVNDHLALDLGGRLTSETVGRSAAFAPRFGLAYSPGKGNKTVFRAGAGLFYDRVSLLEADFIHNPERSVSLFDQTGTILLGPPTLYQNVYVANGSGPLSSRLRISPDTSPRSFVGNLEVDRELWTNAVLRVSYLYSETRDLFVVNPMQNAIGSTSLLALFPTGKARYNEATATLHFRPIERSELNVSYVWSRSRGDLNTISSIFLPFEQPVIRPNAYGILPSDVPNRVVGWGILHLPWSLTVSPVVDIHTGYPYSAVDVIQNYVGVPDTRRFSTFFSFDGQVYREFHLHVPFTERGTRHNVRVGVFSVNLTNHRNYLAVYNNVTSPFFGEFNGFQRRVDGFILNFAP
jgi:hypothetical protein